MGNSYESTLRVRKAFGIRIVNSSKLSFDAHFRNTVKPVPHIFQFQFNSRTMENVQISSSKPYINSYACKLTRPNFRAEITTSEKFQFHMEFKIIEKKLALLGALQFQFHCGTYPIVQLSSFKLPMDSQCM